MALPPPRNPPTLKYRFLIASRSPTGFRRDRPSTTRLSSAAGRAGGASRDAGKARYSAATISGSAGQPASSDSPNPHSTTRW
ncbi:unnamed protein product [Linum trigynum]|uniref:Uncharacterized protein n=1 Tax=Linum trigynum TaxID=586398 RepID=A0AAV2E3Z3_9ROSI